MSGLSVQSWPVVTAVVLLSVAASAFFSGCETGLMSTSQVRLQHRARRERDRRIGALLRLLDRLEDSILACLVGTNLSNVVTSSFIAAACVARWGDNGEGVAVAVTAVVTIAWGEILPKVLYREFPERLTLASTPALGVARLLFSPLLRVLGGYSRLVTGLLPAAEETAAAEDARRALTAALQEHAGDHDRRFAGTLRRFLELAGTDLGRVITPASAMVTVGEDQTIGECLRVAADSGHSRLPVRGKAAGGVAGWLLVRDLLLRVPENEDETAPLPESMVRSCLFVDVGMTPHELFEEFHARRRQLAVVVDAAGAVLGLVTLEDLIETVIGSIEDEFDAGRPTPVPQGR